ncbi:hypothetical protein FNV43_RR13585 [Rhamnella rubrinervis]|uniref:IST1 homolog n=1 Tax=Rhamnella rubrinervis TaxID=2594499 RepID=A0A8K0H1J7_9ROSA|nr:hypothetical protein FNV43_RR13585 [Rhamnella rubrinervis]
MGRTLDALLGRNLKTSKIKTLAKLAIARIAILKNQRQVRRSHARSDVKELLQLGHQQRSLLRVEHVIKEQNMLDVFILIEHYCNLLLERVKLIQKDKECADELKEAIYSLIYAASRCGEFPELHEIRGIFTSIFGKEFAARAVELHNNCGVNPKMIQRLSTRQTSLESRLKVLKEIAIEHGITLKLEEVDSVTAKDKLDMDNTQHDRSNSSNLDDPEVNNEAYYLPEHIKQDEKFSESMKGRKKYRDVEAAAREAFESAAYAAAAARAAVELSTSESQDPDDQNGSNHQRGTVSEFDGSSKAQNQIKSLKASMETKHLNDRLSFDTIYPIKNLSDSINYEIHHGRVAENEMIPGIERKPSSSFKADNQTSISSERKHFSVLLSQNQPLGNNKMEFGGNVEDLADDESVKLHYQSPKTILQKSKVERTNCSSLVEDLHTQHSKLDEKIVSVRCG